MKTLMDYILLTLVLLRIRLLMIWSELIKKDQVDNGLE